MILDQNDPTGLGLFSRCARNQACKATKSRPHTAGSRKQAASELKVHESKRKNSLGSSWFAKHQSRQQRDRKYKKESTPAVGQYNTLLKDKPKMVWDVIKIYQKKNREMKKLQETREKISHRNRTISPRKSDKSLEKQKQNQQSIITAELQADAGNTKFTEIITDQTDLPNQKSLINLQSKNRYHTSASHKSCMVDMSRMSGRMSGSVGRGTTFDESSNFFDIVELNKSIDRIKPKTTKNFYFKKMMGRKDYDKPIGTANIYDCKIGLIKPKTSAQLNFGIIKGREDSMPKQEGFEYGYNHYDYNEYVWKGMSSVFPNTKKHLISFDKQK